jgi:hypothetical protein
MVLCMDGVVRDVAPPPGPKSVIVDPTSRTYVRGADLRAARGIVVCLCAGSRGASRRIKCRNASLHFGGLPPLFGLEHGFYISTSCVVLFLLTKCHHWPVVSTYVLRAARARCRPVLGAVMSSRVFMARQRDSVSSPDSGPVACRARCTRISSASAPSPRPGMAHYVVPCQTT